MRQNERTEHTDNNRITIFRFFLLSAYFVLSGRQRKHCRCCCDVAVCISLSFVFNVRSFSILQRFVCLLTCLFVHMIQQNYWLYACARQDFQNSFFILLRHRCIYECSFNKKNEWMNIIIERKREKCAHSMHTFNV